MGATRRGLLAALQRLRAWRPAGRVWDVGRAMVDEWQRDRVSGLAAEVAFFAVLSVVPGLLALTAGLASLEAVFGQEAADAIERIVLDAIRSAVGEDSAAAEEAANVFAQPRVGLFTVGLVLALWGLSRGFAAVIRALDVAYGIGEGRSWLRLRLMAVAMSIGSLVVAVAVLATLVLGPLLGGGQEVADAVGLGGAFATAWDWLRWPTAFVVLMGWAATVYHLAPNHRTPWRWELPGALLAGATWLVTSAGFQLYLSVAGEGNQVFGTLGGALTLLLWLYLLSIGLLLGGELNATLAGRHDAPPAPGSDPAVAGVHGRGPGRGRLGGRTPTADGGPMDALQLLTADHNRVRGLATRFQAAHEGEDLEAAAALATRILRELEVHTTIEEEIFYPTVQDLSEEIRETVVEGIEEHNVVERLMEEIQQLPPEDEHWSAKVTVMIENVEHHASEEEDELFADIRKELSGEDLEALGERLEARKRELGAPVVADLIDLTKEELMAKAREQEIPGRSSMSREELAATVAPD